MRRYILTAVVLAITGGLTAAAQTPSPVGTSGDMVTAGAVMRDAKGTEVGQVRLEETPHGILMILELKNAAPGVHGLHIHEVGRCDAPTFESAGDHFSPDRRVHGFRSAGGPHAGDLPNIHVPASTELGVELLIPDLALSPGPRGLLGGDGSAIVIHSGPDDHRSDPAGETGDRIACGVVAQNTGANPNIPEVR